MARRAVEEKVKPSQGEAGKNEVAWGRRGCSKGTPGMG